MGAAVNRRRAFWTGHFYDICEWFYWVPRTFNRLPDPANPERGFEAVFRRLSRSEEPLNYIMRILVALGPNRLVAGLTERAIGGAWDDSYRVGGRDFVARYALPLNSTQPDFIFDGVDNFVTMEMKIGAKTSLDQLAKYLYLHAKAEQIGQKPRRHALVYLGPKTREALWGAERILPTHDLLAEALRRAPKTVGRDRVPVDPGPLEDMAGRIDLGFLSYQDVVDQLLSLRATISAAGWEAEVCTKLVDGAVHEIVERKLASAGGGAIGAGRGTGA